MRTHILLLCILATSLLNSCREDEYVIYSENNVIAPYVSQGNAVGMYLLNEGNMGSNKSTLDYLDLSGESGSINYIRNIYSEHNPNEIKELGDVGNDINIYKNQLWMVINCSNKVEVATVDGCKKIAKIDIPNCRYVEFYNDYAYITSYVGPVQITQNTPLGEVYKVDTKTFKIVDRVAVGYQPDELTILNGKIYVANSGGYRVPLYDNTVSVIDINGFYEERKIQVDINLHRIKSDQYGQLWVSSRGDYYTHPSRLFCMKKNYYDEMEVCDTINVAVSDMCIVGDSLYFYGVEWSYISSSNEITYGIVNVKTHEIITKKLSPSPEINKIKIPYGIIVHPENRDFYIMDAKNYVSSGELFHFKSDGTFDWKVKTGDIPAHAVFVWRKE